MSGRIASGIATLALAGALSACGARGAMSDESATMLTDGGRPAHGRTAISAYGCGACHTIGGVPGANAMVGPPLSGIGQRAYVAGVLPNSPDNLVRWIRHPRAVDSLTAMPDLGVSERDARDIAAYLYTLR